MLSRVLVRRNHGDALVTIVVSPREKYSGTRATVERLLTMPSPAFELVVVDDARAPRSLRRWLSDQADSHGFEYITLPGRAGVNELRMRAFADVRTRYAMFIDNDVWLHDGAIEALVRCGEETEASAVAPVYCIGPRGHDTIHHAFGKAHVYEENGKPRLHESHVFDRRRVRDVRHELHRSPSESIEMHCAFVRADALRAAGGLDRELGSSMDCVDLALRMQGQGTVWFEPDAVAGYDNSEPRLRDLPLYLDRWSASQIEHDIGRFIDVWNLDPADPQFERHRFWLNHRRWLFLQRPRRAVLKRFGPRPVAAVKRALDAIDRTFFRHRATR